MDPRTVKYLKGIPRRTLLALASPVRAVLWGRRPAGTPRRILLLNGTHLGDVVISTGLLPVLHSAFPGVEIGYAGGGWAMPVIGHHPLIRYTHRLDLPIRNRAAIGEAEKKNLYRSQRAVAKNELKQLSYDWAIALNVWTPDFIDLAWACGIPVRAAYKRHLLSLLATHLAPSPEKDLLKTEGACQEQLLRALGIGPAHLRARKMSLAASTAAADAEVDALVEQLPNRAEGYYLVHMGAAAQVREMKPQFWREVAQGLVSRAPVIFTGRGDHEAQNIKAAMEGIPGCVSAANRLSWDGLVAAVRRARAVLSVDTSICHVAAATGRPLIGVYTGITGVARWRAEGENVTIWTNHVECSPCGRPDGCAEMRCLENFRPADLLHSLPDC